MKLKFLIFFSANEEMTTEEQNPCTYCRKVPLVGPRGMGTGAPDLKSAPGQGTPRRRTAWPVSRTEDTTKTTQEVCQVWLQSVPLPPTPNPSSLLWFCYISERTMNCSNAQNLSCVRSKYRSLRARIEAAGAIHALQTIG